MKRTQFRRAAIVAVFLLAGGGMLFAGPAWLTQLWTDTETVEHVNDRPGQQASLDQPGKRADEAAHSASPALDIVRISRDAGSVIAGRGKPGTKIRISADGKIIGIVDADENGAWVLVTSHMFDSVEPSIKVAIAKPGDVVQVAEAKPHAPERKRTYGTNPAGLETNRQMTALKGLIDEARNQSPKGTPTAAREVAHPAVQKSNLRASKTLPVPIGFVYREAQFSPEGEKAAALLLEYLMVRQPTVVTLTGHADEVGSQDFNMHLSQQRLDTVRRFLEKGGFKGKLALIPKGETEPYSGVDRSLFTLDALHQLDRRVEIALQ